MRPHHLHIDAVLNNKGQQVIRGKCSCGKGIEAAGFEGALNWHKSHQEGQSSFTPIGTLKPALRVVKSQIGRDE